MTDSADPTTPDSPLPAPGSAFPSRGRLLGLDFGTKRVGVAVSDSEQRYAAPVTVIARSSAKGDAVALAKAVAKNEAVGLVVGLPVHMSGDEGGKAKQAREFGVWAGRTVSLPVAFWDERHTSLVAEGYLMSAGLSEKRRKAMLDALAAQLMLQAYLDATDRTKWTRRDVSPRP